MNINLSKKQQKTLFSFFLLILASLLGLNYDDIKDLPAQLEEPKPGYYQVVKVDDGDTLTVRVGQKEERVRMIGVDTPETQHPNKPVQCFGKAATEFTRGLVVENDVRLVADPEDDNRDLYNRLLRYVYLPDGTLINAELIKQGYGFAYTHFPFRRLEEFRQYQQEARTHRRGLWGGCEIDETGRNFETNAAP